MTFLHQGPTLHVAHSVGRARTPEGVTLGAYKKGSSVPEMFSWKLSARVLLVVSSYPSLPVARLRQSSPTTVGTGLGDVTAVVPPQFQGTQRHSKRTGVGLEAVPRVARPACGPAASEGGPHPHRVGTV